MPNRDAPLPAAAQAGERQAARDEPGILQVLTLVLWLTWLAIGLVGLLVAGSRPKASENPPSPPPQTLDVELATPPPAQFAAAQPSPKTAEPPEPVDAPAPPLPVAALPSPAIAFAIPIEGPVRLMGAKDAAFNPTAARPVVRQLVFGQGLGRQPAPPYPPDAVALGEQGTVGIQLTVGADGRVLSARVTSPSRWPLLNNAALETVRDQWRWSAGAIAPGAWFVSIRFQLNPG